MAKKCIESVGLAGCFGDVGGGVVGSQVWGFRLQFLFQHVFLQFHRFLGGLRALRFEGFGFFGYSHSGSRLKLRYRAA